MLTSASSYTITVRIKGVSRVGSVYDILGRISEMEALIGEIEIVEQFADGWVRDFTIHCRDIAHQQQIVKELHELDGITIVFVTDETFRLHYGGKISIQTRKEIKTRLQLSQAYTPGVGRVSTYIGQDKSRAWDFTIKKNSIAIVSDGSAILGLGDLGAEAALPVMEGKAMLFKQLGGVDAYPLCIEADTTEEIIEFCRRIAPTFGGINLEDISAPRCFEIEDALKESLGIPVFHDDQHGTAIVVLAGVRNALKVVGKRFEDARAVVLGIGAAGSACANILLAAGIGDVIGVDRWGILDASHSNMDAERLDLLRISNRDKRSGSLEDALRGADVFVGLSAGGLLQPEMITLMAKDPIVFAMANPIPEIMPELARPHAAVVASGRSDYPNQINNVLAFPGIFRGALDSHARDINEPMKHAAADAIAACVPEHKLDADYIIPSVFDPAVAPAVAAAAAKAARDSGVSQQRADYGDVLPDV